MLYFHRTILTTNEENMYCYTRKYRSPEVMVLQLRERQLTKKHSMGVCETIVKVNCIKVNSIHVYKKDVDSVS